MNLSVNSIQEAKTTSPFPTSCFTMCLVKITVYLLLQYDKAQWICVWSSGKSDAVSDV
jgi:hypothetical protein